MKRATMHGIIRQLRDAQSQVAAGKRIADVCKKSLRTHSIVACPVRRHGTRHDGVSTMTHRRKVASWGHYRADSAFAMRAARPFSSRISAVNYAAITTRIAPRARYLPHTQRRGRLRRQSDRVASLFEIVVADTHEFYASQKRGAAVRAQPPQLGLGF